ncbi:hypothetical protein [Nocardioides litoris]|uniref:hypothetical protein n=1 Tax=Nocardioides litoris TaxID=1926648 RepID=UPI00112037FB|nr:hypothetical protein [Nocardioides litoris]
MAHHRLGLLAALVLALGGCSLAGEGDARAGRAAEGAGGGDPERAVDRTQERSRDVREPDPELRAGQEWAESTPARRMVVEAVRQLRATDRVRMQVDGSNSYGRGTGADVRFDGERCAGTLTLDQDPELEIVEDRDTWLTRTTAPGWEALLRRTEPDLTDGERAAAAEPLVDRWVLGVRERRYCDLRESVMPRADQVTEKGLQVDMGTERGIAVFLRGGRAVIDLRPPHVLLELEDDEATVTFSEHGAGDPIRLPPADERLDLRDAGPAA